jgi:hypothetical protein
MISHYNTFDTYNDNNTYNNDNFLIQINNKKIKKEGCFICYEIIKNNKTPIRIKSECYYQKNCTCDGWVHKNCLDYWYNKSPICIICRNRIYKNPSIMIKIFKINYNLFVFITFIQSNIRNSIIIINNNIIFIKITYYILLFWFFYDIYNYISVYNN